MSTGVMKWQVLMAALKSSASEAALPGSRGPALDTEEPPTPKMWFSGEPALVADVQLHPASPPQVRPALCIPCRAGAKSRCSAACILRPPSRITDMEHSIQ